jgi:hypothetical protein
MKQALKWERREEEEERGRGRARTGSPEGA